jgi:hypothetical protein
VNALKYHMDMHGFVPLGLLGVVVKKKLGMGIQE